MNYSEMLFNRDERLIDKIKELEEENKRLSKNQRYYKNGVFSLENDKETMSDMIDDYKSRIDKAIKYIGSITDVKVRYFNYREFEKQGLHISHEELKKRIKEQKLEGQYIEIDRDDILKILKGEENE